MSLNAYLYGCELAKRRPKCECREAVKRKCLKANIISTQDTGRVASGPNIRGIKTNNAVGLSVFGHFGAPIHIEVFVMWPRCTAGHAAPVLHSNARTHRCIMFLDATATIQFSSRPFTIERSTYLTPRTTQRIISERRTPPPLFEVVLRPVVVTAVNLVIFGTRSIVLGSLDAIYD